MNFENLQNTFVARYFSCLRTTCYQPVALYYTCNNTYFDTFLTADSSDDSDAAAGGGLVTAIIDVIRVYTCTVMQNSFLTFFFLFLFLCGNFLCLFLIICCSCLLFVFFWGASSISTRRIFTSQCLVIFL